MNSILQKQTPKNDNCFSETLLYDFMLGKVDDDLAARIVNHLEKCSTCEDTVVAIEDKEDTFVENLPKKSIEVKQDSQLDHVIESIKNREFEVANHREGEIHEQLIGDYQIESTLGIGGMGTVFRATHGLLQKDVALKVLPHRKMQNSEAISRFRREMKIIGQLDHPAIVKATDAGHDQGTHYLAMEFVNGFDLSRLIKLVGVLDCKSSCEIIRQAAIGIHYVHSQGIIHRDIKPSNLMLTGAGKVKILDLGLAMLSSVQGMVDELTTVGQLMGTLDYMAPEQYGDCHNIDFRADLYALGATLYKLITGAAPYELGENESPLQKLKRIATETPPPIENRVEDLDPALAKIIDKSISRDQEERFASAEEFAEALEPFSSDSSLESIFQNAKRENELSKESDKAVVQLPQEVNQKSDSEKTANLKSLNTESAFDDSSRVRSGWWLRTALVALFLAGAFCLGIIIQIEMDKGRLVIESDSDNVKVTLLKDGKVYDKMELEQGTNSTRIRAGKYEVLIDEGSDKLILDNDQFKLTRGETIVAKITHTKTLKKPDGKAPAGDSPIAIADYRPTKAEGPVFKGLTLDQWLEKVKVDSFESAANTAPTLDYSSLAAIKRLSKLDKQQKVDKAAVYWANVISNETSLGHIYKLVPLIDILANNEKNSELLLGSFVDCLHRNLTSLDMRIQTFANNRRGSVSYVFKDWSAENRKRIEQKIFDPKNDKIPNSENVRIAFLSRINFNTDATNFLATRENILNLLKAFNESSRENRSELSTHLVILLNQPKRLPAEIRAELISKFRIIARESREFKYLAIRSLIRLGEKTPTVLLDITDNLEFHPELIELLAGFENIDQPIAKIKALLSDSKWGWTNEFRNPPLSPESSRSSTYTSISGMMSSGRSGGGGAMMNGMGGGMMAGNMSASQLNALLGGGGSSEVATGEKPSLRHELVVQLAGLKAKGESLVSTLRKEQSLTNNTRYLDSVWNSIFEITGNDVSATYSGKELAEWKKILNEASSKQDLAIAMIANAQLIGEMDFDSIFFGRPSRTRSTSAGKGKVRVENKNEYRRYIQSLLPKLRNLDFETLDTSKGKWDTCYKDPRMAAYLLCKDFPIDMIQAGNVPDYPFLILLNQEFQQVETYRQFIEDVLTKSKPGSNTQLRAMARIDGNSTMLLTDIMTSPSVDVGVRFYAMEIMLYSEIQHKKAVEGYQKLLEENPHIALALFKKINDEKMSSFLRTYRNANNLRLRPTFVAQLAFKHMLTSDTLATTRKPKPFKQSNLPIGSDPFVFSSEAIVSKSQIEGVLDVLQYSADYGWTKEFVSQLEQNDNTPSTSKLIEKLKATRDSVDKVAQNKIDKFIIALMEARRKHTVDLEKSENKN